MDARSNAWYGNSSSRTDFDLSRVQPVKNYDNPGWLGCIDSNLCLRSKRWSGYYDEGNEMHGYDQPEEDDVGLGGVTYVEEDDVGMMGEVSVQEEDEDGYY